VVESLYIGRLRRRASEVSGTLLARFPCAHLPEHARALYPVLNAYDAHVMADMRAA